MRAFIALLASAGALTVAGAANAASVEIRDAVARVTVVPEDRADVKVEFLTANPKLPLQVRTEDGRTVVDGGLWRRIRNCNNHTDAPSAEVRGIGRVDAQAMPQVVIHTPRAVSVSSNGAVFGAIGRAASLELHDSGCSNWTVADVAGDTRVQESGAGSLRLGSTGRLDLHLSGAASLHVVKVRQGMDAELSGAGGVRVEDFAGDLDANVSGVGRVRVDGGRAGAVRASVSGVGGVDFGGAAQSLDASISGFGSIRVKQVNGPVTKSISGAGHVTVG
ncbi:DUF2807 domain-containing protein [Phenylobacterium sp.]|uniref:GIN domain-containing protein n=1 Tax=Phenylobacterium sp. TaxID=1871053 RepID=UPI0026099A98|nr:DUF2807 domain-containing protein [Phenylobacterium sp.]